MATSNSGMVTLWRDVGLVGSQLVWYVPCRTLLPRGSVPDYECFAASTQVDGAFDVSAVTHVISFASEITPFTLLVSEYLLTSHLSDDLLYRADGSLHCGPVESSQAG